jgi:GNAT superfamily N-acetyltransferase
MVNLPLSDNRTVSYAEAGVPPDRRRQGFGSAILAEVEVRSRAAGRERALFEVFVPPDGDCDGVGFAERHGYTVANREGEGRRPRGVVAVVGRPGGRGGGGPG